MDTPFYLELAVLELSKLQTHETYYDKLRPFFGGKNLQCHYIDSDAIVLSIVSKDIIKDLKKLEDMFDFSNLDKKHETFNNKKKKVIGKIKIKRPQNIWIDDFVCLRSKMCSFKCGDDIRIKLKCIPKSQSKHIKFERIQKNV